MRRTGASLAGQEETPATRQSPAKARHELRNHQGQGSWYAAYSSRMRSWRSSRRHWRESALSSALSFSRETPARSESR